MKVRIQNFQSLKDTTVEVGGLTVLVGPSHRGKSAFVRAVEGALFNRPGDQFVRTGATKAVVTIEDLPSVAGAPVAVTWTKGKSANGYTVDGTDYSRVGTGAPPPIDAAGYRDVWIGDRERKKGTYIRPQVANQFDPLFLLKETGSFVSDVLSVISRHAVLLTAQGRCGSDLKSTKQLLGVRRTDLTGESAKLVVLDEVPALSARVQALTAQEQEIRTLGLRVARVRALTAVRHVLHRISLAGDFIPTATDPKDAIAAGRTLDVLRSLVGRRAALLTVASRRLSERIELPGDLGVRPLRVRALLTQRTRLAQAIRPLPDPTTVAIPDVQVRLRVLVARRTALVQVVTRQMPESKAVLVPKLQPWQEKAEALARLSGRRVTHLTQVQHAEAAHRSVLADGEAVEAALSEALAALSVCPLCEQEMPHATH